MTISIARGGGLNNALGGIDKTISLGFSPTNMPCPAPILSLACDYCCSNLGVNRIFEQLPCGFPSDEEHQKFKR